MFKRKDLRGLRDEVKRLADEGKSVNPRIAALRGPDRHAAREEKAGIGQSARVALLAYALLRGVPYRKLERQTNDTSWSLDWLARQVAQKVIEHHPKPVPKELEGQLVQEWMAEGPEAAPAVEGVSP